MSFLKYFWFNSKNHIRHTCYACPPFVHTGLLFAFLIMAFHLENFRNFSCPINIRFSRTKKIGAKRVSQRCTGPDFGTWSGISVRDYLVRRVVWILVLYVVRTIVRTQPWIGTWKFFLIWPGLDFGPDFQRVELWIVGPCIIKVSEIRTKIWTRSDLTIFGPVRIFKK